MQYEHQELASKNIYLIRNLIAYLMVEQMKLKTSDSSSENDDGMTINITLAHYKHKKKYYLMTKQGVYNFSKRQFQCLQCATDGLTAKETARLLHLSPRTVENYIEIARIKLNCKNKTQLAAFLDSKI